MELIYSNNFITTNGWIGVPGTPTFSSVSLSNIEIENNDKAIEIEAYDLNGNFVASFASITIAEKMTGIHKGNIARNVRGESKTAGGYVWVKKE